MVGCAKRLHVVDGLIAAIVVHGCARLNRAGAHIGIRGTGRIDAVIAVIGQHIAGRHQRITNGLAAYARHLGGRAAIP